MVTKMARSSSTSPTGYILLKEKPGLGIREKEDNPWLCKVDKGELLVEIPERDRDVGREKLHNYRLYSDPEVTLYASPTDALPLKYEELMYLLAVTPPRVRLQEYIRLDKMKEKMELLVDDTVVFKMRVKPTTPDDYIKGVIRYIGPLKESEGMYFGIEITEEKWRGKGTTNGRPYFTCSKNNGVFVSMDKIVKKSQYIPPWSQRQSSKADIVPVPFKPGHRVVLQSVKDTVIHGTVRWVGPIRVSADRREPLVPVVGVETDEKVNPKEHFPELHVNVTGSQGQDLFKVSPHHGQVYLPEQLVVHADDFTKHQDNSTQMEQEIAKDLGLSVDEYRSQKEYLDQANAVRDAKHDDRLQPHDPKLGEEGREEEQEGRVFGAGKYAGGTGREGEGDDHRQLEDTLVAVEIGQISEKQFKEQEEALKLYEQEKKKKDQAEGGRDPSHDYQVIDGGKESIVVDSYVNIAPYDVSQQGDAGWCGYPSPQLSRVKEDQPWSSSSDPQHRPSNQSLRPRHTPYNDHPSGPTSLPSLPTSTPHHHPLPSSTATAVPPQFSIGSMVCVPRQRGTPLHGVIRWIGILPDFPGMIAGVELEEPLTGCTDGTWQGRRFFDCPPRRGYFCPVTSLEQDTDEGQIPANMRQDVPNPLERDAPLIEEEDNEPGDPSVYIGDGRGIQGHHNSCYLDSTVFGLFALTDSFDELLLTEPPEEVGQKVKHFLWKGIVNPLRKYGLARHESVMGLCNSLEEFGQMKGADEKDPEEFLNLLFKHVLHIEPFLSIKRPFGVEKEYFVQLFFELDPKGNEVPRTEKLIAQMFHEQNISFTQVPSKLLLLMPRFGKDFKLYNRIIPSLTLDVKPLLDTNVKGDGEIHNCYFCDSPLITHICRTCPKDVFRTDDPFVYFCSDCCGKGHRTRKGHDIEEVKRGGASDTPISQLTLLSVICIETSHYVCYTRSGDKWLFHDSMANRLYDMYNIPKVVDVSEALYEWVYSGANLDRLMNAPAREIPEYVRRFTQDIYMCVYINPDLDLYGDYISLPSNSTNVPQQGMHPLYNNPPAAPSRDHSSFDDRDWRNDDRERGEGRGRVDHTSYDGRYWRNDDRGRREGRGRVDHTSHDHWDWENEARRRGGERRDDHTSYDYQDWSNDGRGRGEGRRDDHTLYDREWENEARGRGERGREGHISYVDEDLRYDDREREGRGRGDFVISGYKDDPRLDPHNHPRREPSYPQNYPSQGQYHRGYHDNSYSDQPYQRDIRGSRDEQQDLSVTLSSEERLSEESLQYMLQERAHFATNDTDQSFPLNDAMSMLQKLNGERKWVSSNVAHAKNYPYKVPQRNEKVQNEQKRKEDMN